MVPCDHRTSSLLNANYVRFLAQHRDRENHRHHRLCVVEDGSYLFKYANAVLGERTSRAIYAHTQTHTHTTPCASMHRRRAILCVPVRIVFG